LTKPKFIGYDDTTKRQIWQLNLASIETDFAWDEAHGQKFACICAMDTSSIPNAKLSAFCSHLIKLGCAYFCAWGPGCKRMHDLMDEQIIGSNPPVTGIGCLMTTWHAKESLVKAVDYFLYCTISDDDYAPAGCPHGLAMSFGRAEWEAEIERRLHQSMTAQ